MRPPARPRLNVTTIEKHLYPTVMALELAFIALVSVLHWGEWRVVGQAWLLVAVRGLFNVLCGPAIRRSLPVRVAVDLQTAANATIGIALAHVLDWSLPAMMFLTWEFLCFAAFASSWKWWRLAAFASASGVVAFLDGVAPQSVLHLMWALGAIHLTGGRLSALLRSSEEEARIRANEAIASRVALEASEVRLRSLLGCARGVVIELDEELRYANVWTHDDRLLAAPPDKMIGRTLREVLGDAGAPFEAVAKQVFASEEPCQLTYDLEVVGGRRWFSGDVILVPRPEGGRAVAFLSRDITEQRNAEEALRRSEELYRLAARASSEVLWDFDLTKDLLLWSDAAATVLRDPDPPDNLAGFEARIHLDDRARIEESLHAALAGSAEAWTGSYRYQRGDGTWAEIIDRGFIVRDAEGKAVRMVGAMQDTTDRNLLQRQLLHSERLAALGTLSAGVAHEINNPLAYIGSNITFVLDELRNPGPGDGVGRAGELVEALEEAKQGVVRARDIVRDLKLFSRPDLSPGGVDLVQVVDAAAKMATNELRHRARLERVYGDAPPALGDSARLGQVVLNLLINAAQAIPDGNADGNRVELGVGTAPDGRPMLWVTDTGCGIRREHQARIFDPFFTTKPVGEGTGLGLSICHSIVTSLGGGLTVQSAPGCGSTFRVVLPAAVESQKRPEAAPPADSPAAAARILVVDDEPLVGRALKRMLSPRHAVTCVPSVARAFEVLASGDEFDLILCDVMMPDQTGQDLYERLGRERPALLDRVVFMTAGAFSARARTFLSGVAVRTLEKPIASEDLQKVIDDRSRRLARPAANPVALGAKDAGALVPALRLSA